MKLLKLPEDKAIIDKMIPNMDYTNALITNATNALVKETAEDAMEYGFKSISVFPCHVKYASELLKGSNTITQAAIGFPSGNHVTETKVTEAEIALKEGAKELDMMINHAKFFDGNYDYIINDVSQVVKSAKKYDVTVKLIIETGLLDDEQKIKAGELAIKGGAAFIKTCTGFGPGRATMHDIQLLSNRFGDVATIKASGGVASLEDARAFFEAGAGRVAGRGIMVEQLKAMSYQR